MTGKFSYFRHSVSTKDDEKIQELSRLLGRKSKESYFYFFTLLELCASQAEEGQTEFRIHQNTLRTLWESNTRGVQTMCKLLANSALLVCKPCVNHVTFHLPNLPLYLGSYDTKKGKESKEKESKILITSKPSPLSFLFSESDIKKWLDVGTHETHSLLLQKFSHHELADQIPKAFAWAIGKDARAEAWLYTWMSNKETSVYNPSKPHKRLSGKSNGVTATPENPTGNPYTAQRLAKEKEGIA